MAKPELVTVGWAYGVAEAGLAISLLEASGIKVFPHCWYTATFQWHLTHALGGVELQVPAAQAENALDLLAGFQPTSRPRNRLLCLLFAG